MGKVAPLEMQKWSLVSVLRMANRGFPLIEVGWKSYTPCLGSLPCCRVAYWQAVRHALGGRQHAQKHALHVSDAATSPCSCILSLGLCLMAALDMHVLPTPASMSEGQDQQRRLQQGYYIVFV